MIKYLSVNEKLDDLITEDKVLVDFFATWCGPCQMLSEVIEEYSKNNDITIIKVDIDEHQNLAMEFGVMVVPTLCLYENKEQKKKTTGFLSLEELDNFIKD